MKLREALIICSPSLQIQRMAADEIALMTSLLLDLEPLVKELLADNKEDELVQTYYRWKEKL